MPKKLTDFHGLPVVKVSRRGANRLREGHVWVYRSDIVAAEGVAPGALVGVAGGRGEFLGTALYISASQIAIRLISHDVVKDFDSLLRRRIEEAIAYRQRLVHDTNAYRIVFSEGSFLPGLILDS